MWQVVLEHRITYSIMATEAKSTEDRSDTPKHAARIGEEAKHTL
jgi:hypothetical protein